MPSDFLKRFALLFAIFVLGMWGLILIFSPNLVLPYLSSDPLNPALAGMMGAALLGLAIISFGNETTWLSSTRSLGLAVAVLVAVSAFLMFGAGTMLVTPLTTMSMVAAASVAFFLVI